MTKKEQEQVRQLKERLSTLAALRWTDEVLPDIPIPGFNDPLAKGYTPCYDRVEPACSSSGFHAVGRQDKTGSQRPLSLYSTRLLALKALRHQMELGFAKKLATVDLWIAAEKGTEEDV